MDSQNLQESKATSTGFLELSCYTLVNVYVDLVVLTRIVGTS